MQEFLRACHDAVEDAGAKELAAKMGLPHVSLLQRANPDNDSHKLTINHLYQILLHTKDLRPLQELAHAFGFHLVAREVTPAECLANATLAMASEAADVTKAAIEALEDGVVTRIEAKRIEREGEEAKMKIDVVIATAKAKAGAR
ncbi:Rha family transcriptional regulator [Pseudomonas sp. PDM18]|uniref:phage regulatory CII family protein n=1 Tax=Pseudomonas sp. PDM18 TaxID=2769253 RepID=UPI00177EC7C1|nr:phage regulatory CII family protein [Pseudomonas sp. PDM18]MBD9675554.1 Rha family transcriptional regulator [Pseudomonas sp. PDM18]